MFDFDAKARELVSWCTTSEHDNPNSAAWAQARGSVASALREAFEAGQREGAEKMRAWAVREFTAWSESAMHAANEERAGEAGKSKSYARSDMRTARAGAMSDAAAAVAEFNIDAVLKGGEP